MAPCEHHLTIHLDEPTEFELSDGQRTRRLLVRRGQAMFFPALVPFSVRCRRSGAFLLLALDRGFMRCTAQEILGGSAEPNWRPPEPFEDPLVRSLALALKAEAVRGFSSGRAYGEALAAALAAHLVRERADGCPAAPPETAGLGRPQLRRLDAYIQEHLAEDISLTQLARVTGLSPFHFARQFKRSTGLTPHQYVLRQRVERARELLLRGARNIAEVAGAVGFCDQSHLTVHFKRLLGLTPGEFRHRHAERRIFL